MLGKNSTLRTEPAPGHLLLTANHLWPAARLRLLLRLPNP